MAPTFPQLFHPAVVEWFSRTYPHATSPQSRGWPVIARGDSTLVVSPTGSGKTLAAFLWAIERMMFAPLPERHRRCRILYVSPLKALAVDVERNLRAPIAGIAGIARARGDTFTSPATSIRTGDTPAADRARFLREPADILVTTPESLYLLLTSRARERLRSIETVIVDEIHALVPSKRGAHLAVSLERLNAICARPPQRIGLSATQRPLAEVARFLGGVDPRRSSPEPSRRRGSSRRAAHPSASAAARALAGLMPVEAPANDAVRGRPVTIVDAREPKSLRLSVEVPVEDMARLARAAQIPGGATSQQPIAPSIWSSIHLRLVDLIRSHRTTLVFVNNRRLAERLAGALNELAGEPLARAHHGSLARGQRIEVEDLLKHGRVRALVATSSLELGIDMGAVDLVIQVEAPPSVASGLQRIGRAGHQVGAVSEGVIFPKHRGDLIACAAVTRAMHDGDIEESRYPRNPLDVLAQQVVAMASMDDWPVDRLFDTVRAAAPFAGLSRRTFEGVLDMLSGRYPSDRFAELRPRLTWDRVGGTVTGREGARRVAIANAGTIPDRGLYGVFLSGAPAGTGRVGELDEEMVFESRVGEAFVLGASTWRIDAITHDRVLVSPAPAVPGKMPFWRGDRPGRPPALGLAIGRLVRDLRAMPPPAAVDRLVRRHDLGRGAAENLLRYLAEQAAATGVVPDDRTILVERCRDDLGDWRVCVLSPLGGRIHAPWAMASVAWIREQRGLDVETMWTDDGFVIRFPESDAPPEVGLFLPPAGELTRLVQDQLGASALFAATFREVAARSLLLPRRRVGQRTPLWHQRKRASDLLAAASRFGSFPAVLETYRECLQDLFDLPALTDLLGRVAERKVRVTAVDSGAPSPFASSLLFTYVATYLYDGDAPLPERRAQALAVDQDQLRELIGEAELRELLAEEAIRDVEGELQHLRGYRPASSLDALHDLLLRVGDLTIGEVAARSALPDAKQSIEALVAARRAVIIPLGGEVRAIAAEDAGRYRDALGITPPPGLPSSLLDPVADPLGDLALRYGRTHGPFTTEAFAERYGLGVPAARETLDRIAEAGRLLRGEFLPSGSGPEWCEVESLRRIRRRSLARLCRQVEAVPPAALARFVTAWQGTVRRRAGPDAVLDVVEQLQGAPIVASLLEREILPARLEGYDPAQLDALMAAGEIVWVGLEPVGERDGRLSLFLTDHLGRLRRPAAADGLGDPRRSRIVSFLGERGASFFQAIHEACGGGYPADTVRALWELVWMGLVTNDALHPLRAFVQPPPRRSRGAARRPFRSRRLVPPTAEGRWALVDSWAGGRHSRTECAEAVARQLLARHGLVTREIVLGEDVPGGFSALYEVLKTMEATGRVRRGYFVSGLGAAQFALPAALDLLRSHRDEPDEPVTIVLSATDLANPYGLTLKWPATPGLVADPAAAPGDARGPSRSAGAMVVLVGGHLGAYLARGGEDLRVFLPDGEPDRGRSLAELARALRRLARGEVGDRSGLLIVEVNGRPAGEHELAVALAAEGFTRRPSGLQAVGPRHGPETDDEREV